MPLNINGKTIMVETEEIDFIHSESSHNESDLRDSARLRSTGNRITEHVANVAETLEAVVAAVEQGMDKLGPKEWSVELNLGFSGGANVFIANGKVNTGLKVSAKWVKAD